MGRGKKEVKNIGKKQKERQTMSKVYIRSQKKEGLYILDNSQGIRYGTWDREECFRLESNNEKQAGKHYIFLHFNNGEKEKLGEYKSKARCMEIIDEIQEECGKYLYASGSMGLIAGSAAFPPMAAEIPKLYQMPEE